MKTKALSLILAIMMVSAGAWAQEKSKPSPAATATGKIDGATITINYSSPSVKGRKIFGGLEPYGKAWRAGANEATVFETDKDIMVEGKSLPKGKYSFFVVPTEKEFTIIFNSKLPPWGIKRTGEANFDPADNVLTATVTPKKIPLQEKLVYEINTSSVSLKWEHADINFSVK